MKKTKLPDFSIDPTWIKLKKDMGIKLTKKEKARRKSFCARSAGQMKKFPKAAKDPNSRLRQARRRWRC